MVSQIVQKIKRNLSDYGLRVTLQKSLGRVISPIYRTNTYRLYQIDIATAPPIPDDVDPAFTFRLLKPEETHLISQIEEYAEFLEGDVQTMIVKDGFCMIAVQDDQLAGFNIISFGKIYMPLVHLHHTYRAGEAWSEHIAVLPDFRRRRLASLLRYHVFAELRARQYKRLYGGALISNVASLKLAERVGFRVFVDIVYTGVLQSEFWNYRRLYNENP